jgi:integrase
VSEIAGLKWGDLVVKDQGAWVMGKGHKERFIRFSRAAWERLNEYLDARKTPRRKQAPLFIRHDRGVGDKIKAISTLTIERAVTRWADETGILGTFNMTPHSLRHDFATRYLQHTGDLALTQDALGHKSPDTTRIYAKTSREDHIRAHQELFD